jgi:hypothetical protein
MSMVSPFNRTLPPPKTPLQLPTPNKPRLDTRKLTPIVGTALCRGPLIKHLLHTLELLLLLLVLLLLLDTRVPHALFAVGRQSSYTVSKQLNSRQSR